VSKVVFDASVLLAVIYQERGFEKLTPELLSQSMVSAVNLAEVHSKLVSSGWAAQDAWEDACIPANEIAPFTAAQAEIAGNLVKQTRTMGLSLGDRACLALALHLKVPVYTADRSWKQLSLGVRIHVIR
jgi:PIN domain nuclease of toxin-antitoxin system